MKIILIILAIVIVILAVWGFVWVSMLKQTDKTAGQVKPTETMMNNESTNSAGGVMVGGALMTPSKNIIDNAMSSKDHTTLVAAIEAADLDNTLKGSGPFTVFAPTNAAFDLLPKGTVDTLLKPANKEKLKSVLTYHVVPGVYKKADIKNGTKLMTINGEELTFSKMNGNWYINDSALISIADVVSSNGVTHVIDTVLMPK